MGVELLFTSIQLCIAITAVKLETVKSFGIACFLIFNTMLISKNHRWEVKQIRFKTGFMIAVMTGL